MIQRSYTVGGKVIDCYIPSETSFEALENLYDVCNEIFANYSECFYTSNEIKAMKKDPNNKFLKRGKGQ